MKKMLTLLAIVTLTGTAAMANSHNTAKEAVASKPVMASLATPAAVASENAALKASIDRLTDLQAELQSQLAYQQTMAGMFQQLQAKEVAEVSAELEAYNSYDRTMQQAMQYLQAERQADEKADAAAKASYEHMMANMLKQLAK